VIELIGSLEAYEQRLSRHDNWKYLSFKAQITVSR
jgi:hypothetical protein